MKSVIVSNTFELEEFRGLTVPVARSLYAHCHETLNSPSKWELQHSGSYLCEKTPSEDFSYINPPKIQPDLIAYDVWKGEVLGVEDNALVLDVRNDRVKTIRRVLRVKKNRIEGDVEQAFKGMEVIILYKKYKTFRYTNGYQEVEEETTQFMLSQPSQIPLSSRLKEFDERMKRYAYMFEDGKQ